MSRIINNIRNHKNWLEYYITKFTGDRKYSFSFAGRNGHTIQVPQRMMHTYKEIFFDETYLRGFPPFVLKEGINHVIDIGANVGYFSLFMARRYPEAAILACEPMPNNLALLEKYCQELDSHNIFVMPKAVSGRDEMMSLYYDKRDAFTTSASLMSKAGETDMLEVEAVSLQSIFREKGIYQLDFLKLDCEGAEYDILFNAPIELLESIRMIALEYHQDTQNLYTPGELFQRLRSAGFRLKIEGTNVWGWR